MIDPPKIDLTIEDLRPIKSSKQRLLGFDLGDKTIGLAVCDGSWMIASPLELIRRVSFARDIELLKKIVQDYRIGALVSGLPLNMNGSEGPQVKKVRDFMGKISKALGIPVFFWDERLSTVAVTRTLLEADMSRKRRSEVVDKMAATFILQGVLDRLA